MFYSDFNLYVSEKRKKSEALKLLTDNAIKLLNPKSITFLERITTLKTVRKCRVSETDAYTKNSILQYSKVVESNPSRIIPHLHSINNYYPYINNTQCKISLQN